MDANASILLINWLHCEFVRYNAIPARNTLTNCHQNHYGKLRTGSTFLLTENKERKNIPEF